MKESIIWKEELSQNVRNIEELIKRGLVTKQEKAELNKIINKYPMSIPQYYLNLIKNYNDSDPIYRMCIASLEEQSKSGEFDTSGEAQNTVEEGVQHKYKNTVLLLSTGQCAMYCRHCFRKRLVGKNEEEVMRFVDKAIDYIAMHPEVDNVLITGGDSLLNSNRVIDRYLDHLTKLEHIKFIRFGTRTPVVLPSRINEDIELQSILSKYSKIKPIYIVTQFNHPVELIKESKRSINILNKCGIPVLNQTVLLSGVNDSPEILTKLFNQLVASNIHPYYLFQCRPVKGVKTRFAKTLNEAIAIVEQTKAQLSGVAKRFKFCMSHKQGKLEILGKCNDKHILVKRHQSKIHDKLNEILKVPIEDDDRWLDDNFKYKYI